MKKIIHQWIIDIRSIRNKKFYENLKESDYPLAIKKWFKRRTGKELNLENPTTFSEKLQWLKIYDNIPLKTTLSDKYRVREWVAEKIGGDYLIPLLGVWENADEIDFDSLPEQFVLKANHGCGYNIIVPNTSKLDISKTQKQLNKWLKYNYTYHKRAFELQYKDISPCIIAEEYLQNLSDDLYDYKFHCCSGIVRFCQVFTYLNNKRIKSTTDASFKKSPFHITVKNNPTPATVKPENFDDMVRIAQILSNEFKYVRVDLYSVEGKIYFGEMTFTPRTGIFKIHPIEYEKVLGDYIKLS
jgi:hypothetical protein